MILGVWLLMLGQWASIACAGPARQSLDELHKAAVKEGGTLNFYGTLAQINAEKIFPVFEKRFPGIKVNHVDATSDKLVARAVSEARGGKTLGDVLQVPLENVVQAARSGTAAGRHSLPESAEYPEGIKGSILDRVGSAVFHRRMEHRAWLRRKKSPRATRTSSIRAGKTA